MSPSQTERVVSQDTLFDLNSYDYPLPEDRIAQMPAEPRDSSRLLVWSVGSGDVQHRHFRDIVDYLRPEDLLVLNDTRVLPARLLGTRVPGGGRAEVFLLRPVSPDFSLPPIVNENTIKIKYKRLSKTKQLSLFFCSNFVRKFGIACF